MTKLHSDSQAIDRLGIPAIREHFGLTRQAVHYWRREGVPNEYRPEMLALGKRKGIDVPEMKNKRDRPRGRPPMSGKMPASSASPA